MFNIIILFSLLLIPSSLYSQPYYAAVKGVSCASCHVNPSGSGMRKPTEATPTFINDAIALGADLRGAYSNDTDRLSDYSFKALEQRFYVMAEPVKGLIFSYSNESGSTAEAYGMIKKEEWGSVYARFGRFFLPYGLQVSDAGNTAYIKTAPFAPKSVGFSLQPGLTDLGMEIGLAPKENYFLNFSVTNGSNKSGSGSAKAAAGRGGFIWSHFGIGATGFQSAIPSIAGQEQVRYGGFGWIRLGNLVLLGEAGHGSDIESSTDTRKNIDAAYAEISYKFGDAESFTNDVLMKAKLDYLKSVTEPSGKFRYTLGLEWFFEDHFSLEGQYRFVRETPEVADNDQALVLAHIWF